jgi:integrase
VSPDLSAACVKRERLLDLADRREREKPTPAPLSRRNTLAFLRRVFAWAARKPSRTGIIQSPFEKLTREDRKRLFPRGRKRAYIYSPGQLRTIYDRLPPHALPFVRFAAHTGMRLREIATLTWGNVHPDERRVYVESRFGKGPNGGKARDVALGAIPCAILEALRPLEPDPGAEVFRGARGGPIDERNIQEAFDRALLGTSSRAKKRKHEPVWKPANADEKKPRFHDLRKTAATRIEAVSSHAVAKMFLGHADEGVTDSYLQPSLADVREAVNRAARSIDGALPPGTIAFPARDVTPAVTPPSGSLKTAERTVSNSHA